VGVVIMLVLATPFLSVRFGFPDAGNNRAETSTRQAYDMTAAGFGAGADGPQDPRTEDLVRQLRDSILPAATAGTGVDVSVGGIVARSIDSNDNIAQWIPLLITGVVLLSMLLLLVAFRSIAVAVKAAVMNLLSVAAAYGVISLVLQGGWAGQLIGVDTPTPRPRRSWWRSSPRSSPGRRSSSNCWGSGCRPRSCSTRPSSG
jgi:RND superfamily putative drug exporter